MSALKYLDKYAGRRNEIAHGIVDTLVTASGAVSGLALVPPEYANQRRKLLAQGKRIKTVPAYAYTSAEIGHYGAEFLAQAKQVTSAAMTLFLPAGSPDPE